MARAMNVLTALLIIASAFLVVRRFASVRGSDQPSALVDAAPRTGLVDPVLFARLFATGTQVGVKNPAVGIVVFSYYDCGFCGKLHFVLDSLLAKYPDHVGLSIKHSLVAGASPSVVNATIAAECANEQGLFREFDAALFRRQRVVQYRNGWRGLADSVFRLNRTQFDECVIGKKTFPRIERDTREAKNLGIDRTPVSIINGKWLIGAISLATADSIVAAELQRRHRLP